MDELVTEAMRAVHDLVALISGLNIAMKLSLIAIVVGLPPATYYPFMFLRIKWYKSDIGKSMLLKGSSLAAIFWVGIGTLFAVVFDWDWYDWLRLAVNCLLVVAVWYQVITMRRVQKSGELHHRMGMEGQDDDSRTNA